MFLLKPLGSLALSNNESDGNEVVQTKKILKGRQQICIGITILGLFLNDDDVKLLNMTTNVACIV